MQMHVDARMFIYLYLYTIILLINSFLEILVGRNNLIIFNNANKTEGISSLYKYF